ncbi:MAG: hypothetical protein IT340_16620 [Chloroflexi bacterium]|nr:hypothetical protein [Chloroflexota bacterium]
MDRVIRLVVLAQLRLAASIARHPALRLAGAREGQTTIEWVLIAATLATGVVVALGVLTGAISDYITALVDYLNTHKPV